MTTDRLDLASPDLVSQNIDKIALLFPNCVTETDQGKAIDFDLLKQELNHQTVEGNKERYRLEWPGKREAIVTANMPTTNTLRPVREDSVDFDTTENLYIEGDNLEVLKLLQESYLGKIKMIYIDPPYNTGNDFVYKDKFTQKTEDFKQESGLVDDYNQRLVPNPETAGRYHSDWLSMMYARLKLARNLLTDDGVLFVSIDENEQHNLRKICDEIFGENNYCGEIIWKNSSKNDQDYISVEHEYILCYVRDKNINKGIWLEKKEGLDEIYKAFDSFKKKLGTDWEAIHIEALKWYKQFPESNSIFSSKHYNWMDENGVYFPDNISGPNTGQYVYDAIHPVTKKNVKIPSRGWFCPKEKLDTLIDKGLIHFGADEKTVPCLKTYLKNTEYKSISSVIFKDGRVASKLLRKLFEDELFTNPKNVEIIANLLKVVGVKKDDIVLDFFSGSATTSESVFQLNLTTKSKCRFILVQIDEDLHKSLKMANGRAQKIIKKAIEYLTENGKPANICELGKERIRKVGRKIIEEQKLFLEQFRSKLKTIDEKLFTGNGNLLMKDDPKVESLKIEQLAIQSHIRELETTINSLDIGFRVYRLDSSNMEEVYYKPNEYKQEALDLFADNIKSDRSPEDLLTQIMLDMGLPLSLKIEEIKISDSTGFCGKV